MQSFAEAGALLNNAILNDTSSFNKRLREVEKNRLKEQKRSGLWRTILGTGAALGASALMPAASPFLLGMIGGIGSKVGSYAGRKSVGGPKNVEVGGFNIDKKKELKNQISLEREAMRRAENQGAIMDAIKLGVAAPKLKSMANLGKSAFSSIKSNPSSIGEVLKTLTGSSSVSGPDLMKSSVDAAIAKNRGQGILDMITSGDAFNVGGGITPPWMKPEGLPDVPLATGSASAMSLLDPNYLEMLRRKYAP